MSLHDSNASGAAQQSNAHHIPSIVPCAHPPTLTLTQVSAHPKQTNTAVRPPSILQAGRGPLCSGQGAGTPGGSVWECPFMLPLPPPLAEGEASGRGDGSQEDGGEVGQPPGGRWVLAGGQGLW